MTDTYVPPEPPNAAWLRRYAGRTVELSYPGGTYEVTVTQTD
jgi:hypothetical protein